MAVRFVRCFSSADNATVVNCLNTKVLWSLTFFLDKDVAEALGYSNTRDALSKHVDNDDKTTVAICDTGSNYKSQAATEKNSDYFFRFAELFAECVLLVTHHQQALTI